jgi:hypothetical protein
MKTILARHRWLLFFLWLAVSAWGIGLGAKLFELTVLIPAWAANPPQSLNLLPYGPRWPNNPGDFFQPLSAALLLATVGTLVAGWKTRSPYKALLWLSLGALILIWASTPTLFWPMIRDLYWASTGKQPLDSQAATAPAHQWIFYDWIRTALIAVGFVASLLAMSRNADAYSEA